MEEFNSIHHSLGAGEVKHNAVGAVNTMTSGTRPLGGAVNTMTSGTRSLNSAPSGTHHHPNRGGWNWGWGYPYNYTYPYAYAPVWDRDEWYVDENGVLQKRKTAVILNADGSASSGLLSKKGKYAIQGACIGAALGLAVAGFMNKPIGKYAGVGAVIGALGYYLLTKDDTSSASGNSVATVSNLQDTIIVPNRLVIPT